MSARRTPVRSHGMARCWRCFASRPDDGLCPLCGAAPPAAEPAAAAPVEPAGPHEPVEFLEPDPDDQPPVAGIEEPDLTAADELWSDRTPRRFAPRHPAVVAVAVGVLLFGVVLAIDAASGGTSPHTTTAAADKTRATSHEPEPQGPPTHAAVSTG